MLNNSIHLIIISPPYNVAKEYAILAEGRILPYLNQMIF